jgi:hypothetical protein
MLDEPAPDPLWSGPALYFPSEPSVDPWLEAPPSRARLKFLADRPNNLIPRYLMMDRPAPVTLWPRPVRSLTSPRRMALEPLLRYCSPSRTRLKVLNPLPDVSWTSLLALKESADAFPPLKAAVGGVIAICDIAEVSVLSNSRERQIIDNTQRSAPETPGTKLDLSPFGQPRSWKSLPMRYLMDLTSPRRC